MNKIRVILIDGSALARQALAKIIVTDSSMEVVGVAADPMMARMLIKAKKPDVLSLAVATRNIDGMTFLEDIIKTQPMPVVMVSCQTQKGSEDEIHALALGAVEVMGKPSADLVGELAVFSQEYIDEIRLAGRVHANKFGTPPEVKKVVQVSKKATGHHCPMSHKIVALGASTGGTEALRHVISKLPSTFSAVLLVEHLPSAFAVNFVKRLNASTEMNVVEAHDGDVIHCGHVYVGVSDHHFRIEKVGGHYVCRLNGSFNQWALPFSECTV
ncbi:MAG: chemotaxis protein CheB [Mariprofundaceae bacterium]